jgi:hypothetical protein
MQTRLLDSASFTSPNAMRTPSVVRPPALIVTLLLLVSVSTAAMAQYSAVGRRFYVVLPDTTRNLPPRSAEYHTAPTFNDLTWIILFSEDTARVQIRGRTVDRDTVVLPGRSTVVMLDSAERVFVEKREHTTPLCEVTADHDIAVTVYYATAYGAEAFTPLPVDQWGTAYRLHSSKNDGVVDVFTYLTTEEQTIGQKYAGPQAVVIAAYDGTTVKLPDYFGEGPTFTLNKGEAYSMGGNGGWPIATYLTPQMVTADKPIGIVCGDSRTFGLGTADAVTNNSMKNPAMEWLLPGSMLGKRFAYRSFGDIDSLRLRELIRAQPWSVQRTSITSTLGADGDTAMYTGMPYELSLVGMGFIGQRSFEITSSLPINVLAISGPHVALGTPSNDPGFGPEMHGWSPSMTTIIPTDQWFEFTRFHVPASPAQMAHRLSIVADSSAELFLDGVPLDVSESVVGSSFICGSRTIGPGDHVIESHGGRFSGTVEGRTRGYEAYRPPTVKQPDSPPDGVADGGGLMHVAVYAESIGVSYAFPLTGMRVPGDSLRTTAERTCSTLVVEARSASRRSIDSIRYSTVVVDSTNISMTRETIREAAGMIVGWRIRLQPADPTRDARGAVVTRDAFGNETREELLHIAAPIALEPARLALTGVPANVVRRQSVTIINRAPRPVTIASLALRSGSSGFSIIGAPSLPHVLAAGGSLVLDIEFLGTESGRTYFDTLVVDGACLGGSVPLSARTTSVIPAPVPVIEGYDWKARWLSSRTACTKCDTAGYAGSARLSNLGDRPFVVTSIELAGIDAGAFALDSSVAAETIQAGTSVYPEVDGEGALLQRVLFAPLEEREYTATLRVITQDHDTLDGPLTGSGIESHIAVEPAALDLGTNELTAPGSTLARGTITVRALPTRALTVRELRVDGDAAIAIDLSGGFVAPASKDPSTWWRMAPGESREVPMLFAPSTTGTHTARMVALGDHSRCDDSIAVITARAEAVGKMRLDLAIDPATTCGVRSFAGELVNDGVESVMLVGLQITPADAFAQEPPLVLPMTLAPGGRVEIPLRFSPDAPGMYQAELALTLRNEQGVEESLSTLLATQVELVSVRAHLDTLHGLPGEVIETALLLPPLDDAAVEQLEIEVGFDVRAVHLEGVSTAGGIAESWRMSELERNDSLLRLRLESDGRGPLLGGGRILTLRFAGHIGSSTRSALPLRITAPGRACLEFVTGDGLFTLDSICGLALRQITAFEASYALEEARPNPFNPVTTIPFSIGVAGPARLEIADASGRRVALLVDADLLAGRYEVTWDATGVASGLYFSRLQSGERVLTRAVVVTK